jgi:zinc transporter
MTTKTVSDCFVFGFQLDHQGGGMAISSETESDCWLHIDYSIASSQEWLHSVGLPDPMVNAIVREDTRPRVVHHRDGILLLLRGVNTNPGADPEDMVALRMWIEPRRLITARQRKLLSIQDLKREIEDGDGPNSIPELIVRIIERLADRISGFIDSLEDQLGSLETGETSPNYRVEVSQLRRQTASVRRYLAPQREALEVLIRRSGDVFENHLNELREQSDRFVRYVEDLDLIRERALVLQEELTNRMMEEQNSRMYTLSIVAVIFLPITFVSGVFGMNVAGLPGIENPIAFFLVMALMLTISVAVIIYLRSNRWL